MLRINLSRLAALAPLDLFAAGIAKPGEEQTWPQIWQGARVIDANTATILSGNPHGKLAATN